MSKNTQVGYDLPFGLPSHGKVGARPSPSCHTSRTQLERACATGTHSSQIRLIGQKVCLDRTHVPLMLIQPEREGVLAVELFPDSPVTPFRPPIALLRG